MCLGVPGKIVERREDNMAVADINGNQMMVSIVLTPEVEIDEYVLIHAGFAMQIVDQAYALETMGLLLELEKAGDAAHESR